MSELERIEQEIVRRKESLSWAEGSLNFLGLEDLVEERRDETFAAAEAVVPKDAVRILGIGYGIWFLISGIAFAIPESILPGGPSWWAVGFMGLGFVLLAIRMSQRDHLHELKVERQFLRMWAKEIEALRKNEGSEARSSRELITLSTIEGMGGSAYARSLGRLEQLATLSRGFWISETLECLRDKGYLSGEQDRDWEDLKVTLTEAGQEFIQEQGRANGSEIPKGGCQIEWSQIGSQM